MIILLILIKICDPKQFLSASSSRIQTLRVPSSLIMDWAMSAFRTAAASRRRWIARRMPLDDQRKKNAVLRGLYAVKYARGDDALCQIEEGLFLGSMGAAFKRDALKASNVTHILTVAESLEPAYPEDFTYKKIGVLDNPFVNLAQHFDACFEFIDEARRQGGAVLVHCFAGRSRSATIVVGYLMMKQGISLHEALNLVRSKRPQICPNHGFIRQLEALERRLRGTWIHSILDRLAS